MGVRGSGDLCYLPPPSAPLPSASHPPSSRGLSSGSVGTPQGAGLGKFTVCVISNQQAFPAPTRKPNSLLITETKSLGKADGVPPFPWGR